MLTNPPREQIRRAEPREADALTALARRSKAHWPYPRAWLDAWEDDLTLDGGYIQDRDVYASFDGDAALGVYALSFADGRAELEHFWVDPGGMGRGVGRRLLAHAVERARERGASELGIDADPHAEGFYLRLGAQRTGRTPAPMDGAPDRCLPRLVLFL